MADPDQTQPPPSRAVEEQSAQQRAVSRLLGQIAGRLETLAGEVTSLGEAVGAVDVDLRRSTTLLADRINALSASLAEQVSAGTHEVLGRDVAAVRGELERLAARTAAPALDEVSATVHSLLEQERPEVRRLVGDALEAERPQTEGLVVTALEAERSHALTAAQVAAIVRSELEVERAHNAQAVVEASEQRILAYVDTAVLALAEALLVPRRPDGTPGLAVETPAPSPPAEDPSLEQTPPADDQPVGGVRRARWRSAT